MVTFLHFKFTRNPFGSFLGKKKQKPQGKKETTAQPIPHETLSHCSPRHSSESAFWKDKFFLLLEKGGEG